MTQSRKVLLGLGSALATALIVGIVVWAVPAVKHAFAVKRHITAAAAQEAAILEEWTKEFGDPAGLPSRLPATPDDPVALRVAEKAKELEIEMHASSREPGEPLHDSRDRLFDDLGRYVRMQLERTSGELEAPPTDVCDYLEQHAPAIDEMAEILADSDPPRWEAAPASPVGPSPNLRGHLRLQRVLVADALARTLRGEPGAAERRLLAAWKLNASLSDRADLISQIMAIACARMHTGAARWIPLEDSAWDGRLVAHDYRKSIRRALAVEAAAAGYIFAGDDLMMRGSRADYYRIHLDFLRALEASSIADSARGSVVFEDRPEHALSPGGIVAGIGAPNTISTWRRVDRLRLEAELTVKILEARRAHRREGRWPQRLRGVEESVLGEPHWVYTAEGGRMRISLSSPLEWKNWSGSALPLEFAAD